MAMARRTPDAATARGHCAVAGRPAWGALQHGGEGAEGTAEGMRVEIVPDADGSCKITEARSPTDPEHEEQEENHSRAHRDRTAGHASQTEDLRSSPSEKTPRGQAEQGRATAGVSAEKSQTTAKQHLDFYTPRKHSNTEAITSFSGKKKKKQYSSLRGKTPNTYENVTCVSNGFSFSVMTSAQTAQGWEKGELASGALVLTEARGSLLCVLGPVSDTTEHVICAGTFDTANKHECL